MKKRTQVLESDQDFPWPILFPFPFFSFPFWPFFSFLCTSIVHLYRPPPPSILFFTTLSLCCVFIGKTKILFPRKLNAGFGVIKERMLQQEKRRLLIEIFLGLGSFPNLGFGLVMVDIQF